MYPSRIPDFIPRPSGRWGLWIAYSVSGLAHATTTVAQPAAAVEAVEAVEAIEAQTSPEAPAMTINLNTADEATLQRELSGVGAAKARAIVAYREANGEFASTDELLEVKGIGKAIFEKNRDKVAVN